MAQPFEIEFTQSALDDLRYLRRTDQGYAMETIDLDEEIESIRRNQELMEFLDQRSQETERYTLAQVREILQEEAEAKDSDHQSRT